jgi:hypothetical protein
MRFAAGVPHLVNGDHLTVHCEYHAIRRETVDACIPERSLSHLPEWTAHQVLKACIQGRQEAVAWADLLLFVSVADRRGFVQCRLAYSEREPFHFLALRNRLIASSLV